MCCRFRALSTCDVRGRLCNRDIGGVGHMPALFVWCCIDAASVAVETARVPLLPLLVSAPRVAGLGSHTSRRSSDAANAVRSDCDPRSPCSRRSIAGTHSGGSDGGGFGIGGGNAIPGGRLTPMVALVSGASDRACSGGLS